jgi:hypothetical protein
MNLLQQVTLVTLTSPVILHAIDMQSTGIECFPIHKINLIHTVNQVDLIDKTS